MSQFWKWKKYPAPFGTDGVGGFICCTSRYLQEAGDTNRRKWQISGAHELLITQLMVFYSWKNMNTLHFTYVVIINDFCFKSIYLFIWNKIIMTKIGRFLKHIDKELMVQKDWENFYYDYEVRVFVVRLMSRYFRPKYLSMACGPWMLWMRSIPKISNILSIFIKI